MYSNENLMVIQRYKMSLFVMLMIKRDKHKVLIKELKKKKKIQNVFINPSEAWHCTKNLWLKSYLFYRNIFWWEKYLELYWLVLVYVKKILCNGKVKGLHREPSRVWCSSLKRLKITHIVIIYYGDVQKHVTSTKNARSWVHKFPVPSKLFLF